jgi:hypothetical protein
MKLSVEHKVRLRRKRRASRTRGADLSSQQMFSPGFFRESLGHFRQWLDDLVRLHRRPLQPTAVLTPSRQFSESWAACQDADILIESPSTMAGIHVAEALGIPYFRAFTSCVPPISRLATPVCADECPSQCPGPQRQRTPTLLLLRSISDRRTIRFPTHCLIRSCGRLRVSFVLRALLLLLKDANILPLAPQTAGQVNKWRKDELGCVCVGLARVSFASADPLTLSQAQADFGAQDEPGQGPVRLQCEPPFLAFSSIVVANPSAPVFQRDRSKTKRLARPHLHLGILVSRR